MIIFLSLKQWDKYKKKLVEPKDYIIMDATTDTTKLQNYTNTISTSDIAPPPKLVHAIREEDFTDMIDEDAIKELESAFFNGMKFRVTALAIINNAVSNNVNTFVVLENVAFKFWKARYRKTFINLIPGIEEYVFVMPKKFKELGNILEEDIPESKRNHIMKQVKGVEKDMEKEQKQKKKKRKKKKKFSGMGFEDWV